MEKWSKHSDNNILDTNNYGLGSMLPFLWMVCVNIFQVADYDNLVKNKTHRLLHFILLSVLLYSGQSSGSCQAYWECSDQNTKPDEEDYKFYPKLAAQRKQRKSYCCACTKEGGKSTSEMEELHAYIKSRTSLSLTKNLVTLTTWLLICILLITERGSD